MPSNSFYDENSHAIRDNAVVTRDAIPLLAVQIVSAKYHLATEKPENLLDALYETIAYLQKIYEQKHY